MLNYHHMLPKLFSRYTGKTNWQSRLIGYVKNGATYAKISRSSPLKKLIFLSILRYPISKNYIRQMCNIFMDERSVQWQCIQALNESMWMILIPISFYYDGQTFLHSRLSSLIISSLKKILLSFSRSSSSMS